MTHNHHRPRDAHKASNSLLFLPPALLSQGRPGAGKSSALFQLKNGEALLTPTPGGEGFYVESLTHAGIQLNVWEIHSAIVRDKCLATARAMCFVVDCTEDSAGIEQGVSQKLQVIFGVIGERGGGDNLGSRCDYGGWHRLRDAQRCRLLGIDPTARCYVCFFVCFLDSCVRIHVPVEIVSNRVAPCCVLSRVPSMQQYS